MEGDGAQPRLQELIERGFIQAPASLSAEAYGCRFEAVLQRDGSVISEAEVFNSLSVAAGTLITNKTGRRTPGRRYWSCNGWRFWHLMTADGQLRPLAEIRQRAMGQT